MTDPKVKEWMTKVEETLVALRWADRQAQEDACEAIKDRHGEEAADKLRELFEIEHGKVARFVDRANKAIAGKPSEPIEKKPAPVEKRDKHGNVYRLTKWGYRRVLKSEPEPEKPSEPKPQEEEKEAVVGARVVVALKPLEQTKPEPDEKSEVVEAKVKPAPLGFQHSKNPAGIPAILENAITAVNKLGIECRYDVFHDRIIVKGHECGVRGDAHENLENVTLKVRQAVL